MSAEFQLEGLKRNFSHILRDRRFLVSLARFSVLVFSLMLFGCSDSTVEVRITPDVYQVGSVKSPLATPAVDEVVRMNPQRVLMVMCRSTPPAKIIQFERELRAKNQAILQGTHMDEGCPA
ncbi:hypothetical protein QTH91_03040 [Variovorax dokdonensis]|uniref:Uncharacterized protein n=1 Tax=Variovorax dokdonensis TaxID=344883 RepID=A0ABT7N6D8_9BURK|nr:hypothetical protein [Variovorax dokdonensis]MDM0043445.1 hypothetical protein [Variovorax dokdonensis]